MEVPVYDKEQAQDSGSVQFRPESFQANTSVAQSMEHAGAAIGHAVDNIGAQVEKAQADANAVKQIQGQSMLQEQVQGFLHGDSTGKNAGVAGNAGFLALQGESAAKTAAEQIQQLDAARSKIASQFDSQHQRARFLGDTEHLYLASRLAIEKHVEKQAEQAKVDGFGVAEDNHLAFLTDTANGPVDADVAEGWRKGVAALAYEAAGGGSAGTLASKLATQKSLASQLKGMLDVAHAPEDIAAARSFLESNARRFADGPGGQGALKAARDTVAQMGQDTFRDRLKANVAAHVAAISDDIRINRASAMPDAGLVDPDKFLAEAERRRPPATDPLRDEYDANIQRERVLIDQEVKARVQEQYDVGYAAVLGNPKRLGTLPTATENFLKKWSPKTLEAIHSEARARLREWKADTRGDAAEARAEKARRAEAASTVIHGFRAALADDANADPKDFATNFLAEQGAAGNDVSLPDSVRAQLAEASAKAKKGAGNELAAQASDVRRQLESEFRRIKKVKPGQKGPERELETMVGNALAEYDARVTENKGRRLSPEQVRGLVGDATAEVVTKPGFLWDSKGYGAEKMGKGQPPPGPPAAGAPAAPVASPAPAPRAAAPAPKPAASTASKYQEGQTATGKGGEKYTYTGGKWVKK